MKGGFRMGDEILEPDPKFGNSKVCALCVAIECEKCGRKISRLAVFMGPPATSCFIHSEI